MLRATRDQPVSSRHAHQHMIRCAPASNQRVTFKHGTGCASASRRGAAARQQLGHNKGGRAGTRGTRRKALRAAGSRQHSHQSSQVHGAWACTCTCSLEHARRTPCPQAGRRRLAREPLCNLVFRQRRRFQAAACLSAWRPAKLLLAVLVRVDRTALLTSPAAQTTSLHHRIAASFVDKACSPGAASARASKHVSRQRARRARDAEPHSQHWQGTRKTPTGRPLLPRSRFA